jgi:hypothetical protein
MWERDLETRMAESYCGGERSVDTLLDLQEEYRTWLDSLPANLEASRLAEKLRAIAELDLDELQAIDPPRGYGRD